MLARLTFYLVSFAAISFIVTHPVEAQKRPGCEWVGEGASTQNSKLSARSSQLAWISEAEAYGDPRWKLFYFTRPQNCPWCVQQENQTWRDPQVIAASKDFACAKVPEYRRLLWHVDRYPTTILVSPDLRTAKRFARFVSPEEMLEAMRKVSK